MQNCKQQSVALFDIDGTLLDSAALWEDIPAEYLRTRGLTPNSDVLGLFSRLGYSKSARHLVEHYLPGEDPYAVMSAFCMLASEKYAEGVEEKPCAAAYLRSLTQKGVRCAAVTSNMRGIVLPALERLHMTESLGSVTSIYDIGLDKRSPDLFHFMADKLNTDAAQCVVFEDALFAAESAKKAGMRVVGIYDRCSDATWPALMQTADRTITTFQELIDHDVFA